MPFKANAERRHHILGQRHRATNSAAYNTALRATAQTASTMRDQHLQAITESGHMAWQKASGYNWRALVEAGISRFKRVIGDGLRSALMGVEQPRSLPP